MRKVPIKLTDLELWAIYELAKTRNKNKENHGVKTKRVDRQVSDVEMHYIGMKAEYAVSKLIGAEFNPENMLSGDKGVDFVYNGLSVDVKLSQKDMKFVPGTFLADIAILVQPLTLDAWTHSISEYEKLLVRSDKDSRVKKHKFAWKNILAVGWVSKDRFDKEHEIKNFGYSDVEFMDVATLSPLKELRDYARSVETNN